MNIMDEKQIPQVRVGIMNEPTIDFVLNGDYRVNGAACSGSHTARCVDGQVEWNGGPTASCCSSLLMPRRLRLP